DLRTGTAPEMGRDEVRGLLSRQHKDQPCFLVSTRARWVLNALSGGYAYAVDRRGTLSEEPRQGAYRTLMEGLESFAGLTKIGMVEAPPTIRVTDTGAPYFSILPNRPAYTPSKLDALRADDIVNSPLTLRRR